MPSREVLSIHHKRSLAFVVTVAAGILAVGLFVAPERAWSNLFVSTFYLLTIGMGGTLFIALTVVTGASWHLAFRRVPEAMAMIVPATGVAVLAVLVLRLREYGWHHHGDGDAGTFWFKELWLTPSFWFLRSVGYLAIWSALGGWMVRRLRNEAAEGTRSKSIRPSVLFLIAYAVTFSLASADWIMALDPLWFSTMWGVYNFSGMILSALAVVVMLCVVLSKPGRPLDGIFNTEHLHDLGKLIVGFSCFWMYIWFSQYMLIWYTNLPEEVSYFVIRTRGPWAPIVVMSIVLNWLVPFLVLLPKSAKRSASVMLRVAVVILIGRWVDLSSMVFPSTVGETPIFGILEVAAVCGTAAAGILLIDKSLIAAHPVSVDDVYLQDSLNYHA